ncbi:MAG: kelch repeat-containing protein [Thermomicrobiales bacterium]
MPYRPHPDAVRLTRRAAMLAAGAGVLTGFPAAAQPASPSPAAETGWTPGPSLPVPRSEFTAATLDGKIYVAGGFGAEQAFSRLDPATGTWTELASLPAPRHHLGLAALDNAIYAIGGHDAKNTATDTAWRYDLEDDAWRSLLSLPQGPRGALGCAVLDGRILTVGGSSGDLSGPATADVAAFDPVTGTWETLPAMPTAREHLAVATVGGILIAIGGRNGGQFDPKMDTAVERYDPTSNGWTAGAALPDGRSGMGVATNAGSVVVLGGEGRSGIYDHVQRYDVAANVWSDLPSLPVARHGIAAATDPHSGLLYAIGGSTSAFTVSNTDAVDVLSLPPLA